MKRILMAALLAAMAAPALAGGYLPDHCAKLAHPPPKFFECPTPYVEMIQSGSDKVFSRAWHCQETGHFLGVSRYGGCAGGKESSMFSAWTVPAATSVTKVAAQKQADLHAEVLEWVFQPCMEAGAAFSVKSMDQEKVDLGIKRRHIAKVMLASRDAAIKELVGKLSNSSWDARRKIYPLMLRLCLSQIDGMK